MKLFDNSLVLPNKGPIDWQTRKKQPISEAGDLQIYGLAPLWLIYQTVSEGVFPETHIHPPVYLTVAARRQAGLFTGLPRETV